MALIDISIFKGEIPLLSEENLPNENASTAENCDLENGSLMPVNGNTAVQDLQADTETIYKMSDKFLEWASKISIIRALVADSGGRIAFTGDGYPKETNEALALTGSAPYPVSTRRLGIPAPTVALTVSFPSGNDGDEVVRSSSYVFTILGEWEDGSVVESAPSVPTGVFDVTTGAIPHLSGFVDSAVTGVYTTHFRIYRLNSGNVGAEYQFMKDIPITATETDDDVSDDSLGEVLPSTIWTSPDDDLHGLFSTSHSMVFAFKGNTIYPAEIFFPYAFPDEYTQVTESDIVGGGYIGSLVVVLTETVPYLLIGQTPETLALKRLSYQQKCVSSRSIVSVPGGVVYASPDGLIMVNESGICTRITKGLFKKSQWSALGPENLFSFYYDDKYVGFFSGSTRGFSLNMETGEYKKIVLSEIAYGGSYSPEDDILYLIQAKNSVREVVSFHTGSVQDYSWYTKIFVFTSHKIFSVCQIIGDFSDGKTVLFELSIDGVITFSKTVSSDQLFRVSNPIRGKKAQVRLTGTATIKRLILGESVFELVRGLTNV